MNLSQYKCHVAGIVARVGVALLVRILVFLVNDYKPKIFVWKENSRPYTYDNLVFVFEDSVVNGGSCRGGMFAVKYLYRVAKIGFETRNNLRSYCNFGQKIKYFFPFRQSFLYELYVNFGLAA